MSSGAITSHIDVAQLTLYAFWIFFAGLVFYLRKEDKREGYPLDTDLADGTRGREIGFPAPPDPKVFLLPDGKTITAPREEPLEEVKHAKPVEVWPGAPMEPTGDPMVDAVGPAAYAQRPDVPELTFDGRPRIVPLRVEKEFSIHPRDPDPRGMDVIAADNVVAGVVSDVWVDRSEPLIRYLEVEVRGSQEAGADEEGKAKKAKAPAGARSVLVPNMLLQVSGRREVRVDSVIAAHFAKAPTLRNRDQVTQLEEDRIGAFFASGNMYSKPKGTEPWI